MADMAQRQQQSFEERIGRIRTGDSVNLSGELHVGPREEVRAKDVEKAKKKQLKKRRRERPARQAIDAFDVLLFPVAMAVGALALLAGRLVTFHFLTPGGRFPIDTAAMLPGFDVAMWGDLALIAAFALILAWMFRFTTGLKRLGVLMGVALMMPGETLLVQNFPDEAALAFSDSYVAEARARPDPVEWPQTRLLLPGLDTFTALD